MATFSPLTAATVPAILLVAVPRAVAGGRDEDLAYNLGYRAGQITADVLTVAVVLAALVGGTALVRRALRRRRAGRAR
ncbi:MAG: hypothetical protein AB7O78_19915 [Thermoleophilia bacterium]